MLTTSAKINIYSIETGKFIRAMKTPSMEAGDFAMLRTEIRLPQRLSATITEGVKNAFTSPT